MQDTRELLLQPETTFPKLRRNALDIIQVNLGYLCNLSCVHCHVNAGPTRTELMSKDNIDLLIKVLEKRQVKILDLTGGAPEMNPHFKTLVSAARAMGIAVIDRCNLAILSEPGYEDLADFLAEQGVSVVASLPCYSEENVDKQRGKGAFDNSVIGLQKLNALGYGKEPSLCLDLVFNPQGPVLPPPQSALEEDYKRILMDDFGIVFNSLLTIANMPISRFGAVLLAQNQFDDYMNLLKENYAQDNLSSVMCRSLVSIDWQGHLFDCDFNQMLDMPITYLKSEANTQLKQGSNKMALADLLEGDLTGRDIQVAEHCFGCTAGQGSSCSGAL